MKKLRSCNNICIRAMDIVIYIRSMHIVVDLFRPPGFGFTIYGQLKNEIEPGLDNSRMQLSLVLTFVRFCVFMVIRRVVSQSYE